MKIKIGSQYVGDGCPTLIIAELSANHLNDFNLTVKTLKEAKKAGASAFKMQVYTADTLTVDADNKYFRIKHKEWGGQTLHQLYKKAYTPWPWIKRLKKIADDLGIVFFATAFDKTSVDFLEEINVPVHKIASFELVDLPLIEYAAKTKKPLIMSTGMATLTEIKEAVATARRAGAKEIILLKCVSTYPAKPDDMNLKTIADMKKTFQCPVGLSDHTLGTATAVASVVLGAQVIEKHFILSRSYKTPDSFFSIEPKELRELVGHVRVVEKAVGQVHYGVTPDEKNSLHFRRSLFVVEDIQKGGALTEENVRSIRPADGLKPKYLKSVLGRTVKTNVKKGTPLSLDLLK